MPRALCAATAAPLLSCVDAGAASGWSVPLRIGTHADARYVVATTRGGHIALVAATPKGTVVSVRDPASGATAGTFVADVPATFSHGRDGSLAVLSAGESPMLSRIAPDGSHAWTEPVPGAQGASVVADGIDGAYLVDYDGGVAFVRGNGAQWFRARALDEQRVLGQHALESADLFVAFIVRNGTGERVRLRRYQRSTGNPVWTVDGPTVNLEGDANIVDLVELAGSVRVVVRYPYSDVPFEILVVDTSNGALVPHPVAASAGACGSSGPALSYANLDLLRVCENGADSRVERISRTSGAIVWSRESPGSFGIPRIAPNGDTLIPLHSDDSTTATAAIFALDGSPVLELEFALENGQLLDSLLPLADGDLLLQFVHAVGLQPRTERRSRNGALVWRVDGVEFEGAGGVYNVTGGQRLLAYGSTNQGGSGVIHVAEIERVSGAILLGRAIVHAPGQSLSRLGAVSPAPGVVIVGASSQTPAGVSPTRRCGVLRRLDAGVPAAEWMRGCGAYPRDLFDSLVQTDPGYVFTALRREAAPGALLEARIERVEVVSGSPAWSVVVPERNRFLVAAGSMLIEVETTGTDTHRLIRRDPSNGAALWSREFRSRRVDYSRFALDPDGNLLFTHSGIVANAFRRNATVLRLAADTGQSSWSVAFDADGRGEEPHSLLATSDGVFLSSKVGAAPGARVRRLALADGAVVWTHAIEHALTIDERPYQLRDAPGGEIAFVRERTIYPTSFGGGHVIESIVRRLARDTGARIGDHWLSSGHGEYTHDPGGRAPSYFAGPLGPTFVTSELALAPDRAGYAGSTTVAERSWPARFVAGNTRVSVSISPQGNARYLLRARVDYEGETLPAPIMLTVNVRGSLGRVDWTCSIEGTGLCGRAAGSGFDASVPVQVTGGSSAVFAATYDVVDGNAPPSIRASAAPPFALNDSDTDDNLAFLERGDALFSDGME